MVQPVKWVTLGELGTRNKGTQITATRMKAIAKKEGSIRVFAGGQTIADVNEDAIPQNDVIRVPSIIVKSRGNIGFTYYERPFSHKAELRSYSIASEYVDQKYVYYYLTTQTHKLQRIAQANSVKIPQLNVNDTDRLQVPIPPLKIQRDIVSILDKFDSLVNDLSSGLPAEINARRKQYEYYRDRLLTFDEAA